MPDAEYPIRDTTKLTNVGRSHYIRIPFSLVKSGKFPIDNMTPLVITIESKDKIVITLLPTEIV